MRTKSRTWTCVCEREISGNGGRASHVRACRAYKESKRTSLVQTLESIDAGTWGPDFKPALREGFQHQFELELERLNEDLAVSA